MSCPWDALEPANLRFCEADVCGWIAQPANTWSNVGFLAAAAWVLARGAREARPRARTLGWLALATGLTSTAFHATSTLLGQLLDQSAMLLESSFFVVATLDAVRPLARRDALGLYAILTVGSIATLLALPTLGIALFAAQIIAFASLEAWLLRRARHGLAPRISYRPLAAVIALFVASYAAWWLDRLGVVCDPDDHVFGLHALWHLLGAASFPAWYLHFAQREAC